MTTIRLAEEIRHEHITALPANEMKAPGYGTPQRDAINSVVDGLASDLCAKIRELRAALEGIEQRVLENTAELKIGLQDQVALCSRFNDEITRVGNVIKEINDRTSV